MSETTDLWESLETELIPKFPRHCLAVHQKGPKAQGTLLLKKRRGGKPNLSLKHHSSFRFVYPDFQGPAKAKQVERKEVTENRNKHMGLGK